MKEGQFIKYHEQDQVILPKISMLHRGLRAASLEISYD